MTSCLVKIVNKKMCRGRVDMQSCRIRRKVTCRGAKIVNIVVQKLSIRGRVEDVLMLKVVSKKTCCDVELDVE